MSLSNQNQAHPTTISVCTSSHNNSGPHNQGNGRDCTYGVDSENYSTNTLEKAIPISPGSVRAQSQ